MFLWKKHPNENSLLTTKHRGWNNKESYMYVPVLFCMCNTYLCIHLYMHHVHIHNVLPSLEGTRVSWASSSTPGCWMNSGTNTHNNTMILWRENCLVKDVRDANIISFHCCRKSCINVNPEEKLDPKYDLGSFWWGSLSFTCWTDGYVSLPHMFLELENA